MQSDNGTPFWQYCSRILPVLIFLISANVAVAVEKQSIPANQHLQKQVPASVQSRKQCADLSVNLKVTKSRNGMLALKGVVTNNGPADFTVPAQALFIMNVRHLPKTYAQIGISEQLCPTPLSKLKKGASMPVSCKYKIPDFKRWADAAPTRGESRLLFTFAVQPSGPSLFKASEECNENNNHKAVEISYQR